MKVILPTTITASMVTGSTIAEPDTTITPAEAIWLSGTTYALGARTILTATHKVYQSLQASNLNHAPVTDGTPDAWWAEVQPTNKFAPFDLSISTAADCKTGRSWTIVPGLFDAFAAIGLAGDSIRLQVASGLPYDSGTVPLDATIVNDWADWLYPYVQQRRSLVMFDVPPVGGQTATVTLNGPTIPASVGALVFGVQQDIGKLIYAPRLGITDLSRIEDDGFGNDIVVERRFKRTFDGQLRIPNTEIERVRRVFEALRAKPAVWSGIENHDALTEPLTMFAFLKEWQVEITYPTHSLVSLRLQGLAQT